VDKQTSGRSPGLNIAPLLRVSVAFVVLAPSVFCQQVSGTAQILESHAGSPGTTIVLVSPSGVIIAGTLSRADGGYSLRAPSPGRYRVRARRIGFAPDSSDVLTFRADGELHFDPLLKPLTASLQAVSVAGAGRCIVRPGSGAQTFRLWEAAQNALSATIAASTGKLFAFRLGRFQREIDPATKRIIHGSEWEMRALSSEPYYSISPDSLAATGFARTEGDSAVYFAPDARTLTSAIFAQTHCMRIVQDRAKPEQIGLAFEPVAQTRLVDVAGVLWLDRTSGELRNLEYRYELGVGNRGEAGSSETASATGRIEYRRLDNGGWIVNRWLIRVPIQKNEPSNSLSSNEAGGNLTVRSTRVARTTALWEIGGDVRAVLDPSDPAFGQQSEVGAVRGSVVNGANHVGVPNVEIHVTSNSRSAQPRKTMTAKDGFFVFDSLPEGEYILTVSAASFDTLNTLVSPIPLRISASTLQSVTIAIPSAEEGRAALCSATNPSSIVVHGFVTDSATRQRIAGARVESYWLSGTTRNIGGLSASAHQRVTVTDSSGKYVFCGMEPTTRLLLSASLGSRKSRRTPSMTIAAGDMRLANLQIPR
jgi:carboxypeptidase family protein